MNHSSKLPKHRCSQMPSQWAILPRFCLMVSLSPFTVSRTTHLPQARTPSSPPTYSQKTPLQQLQQLFSWERSTWEVFNVFLTVFPCSQAAGSQVQSQSTGFILCDCTSCLFAPTLSRKMALPWMPSCPLTTRTPSTSSCTAGSNPWPWSWPMIYLNRTSCMFPTLSITANWKLTST